MQDCQENFSVTTNKIRKMSFCFMYKSIVDILYHYVSSNTTPHTAVHSFFRECEGNISSHAAVLALWSTLTELDWSMDSIWIHFDWLIRGHGHNCSSHQKPHKCTQATQFRSFICCPLFGGKLTEDQLEFSVNGNDHRVDLEFYKDPILCSVSSSGLMSFFDSHCRSSSLVG